MQIPDSFRTAISSVMYVKTITKYTTTDSVDAEGWARIDGTTATNGTFLGNVHFDNFEKVQEDHGITEKIDITITTDEEIELETIVGYEGKQYKIFEVIANDSHYLLVGRKWLSKSSISISA